MPNEFFPLRPKSRPTIYAYEDTNPQYAGLLKVGYTTVDVRSRVAQQYPTLKPGKPPYRIVLEKPAMRNDGTTFTDHHVHGMLRINGVKNVGGEWFRIPAFFPDPEESQFRGLHRCLLTGLRVSVGFFFICSKDFLWSYLRKIFSGWWDAPKSKNGNFKRFAILG